MLAMKKVMGSVEIEMSTISRKVGMASFCEKDAEILRGMLLNVQSEIERGNFLDAYSMTNQMWDRAVGMRLRPGALNDRREMLASMRRLSRQLS